MTPFGYFLRGRVEIYPLERNPDALELMEQYQIANGFSRWPLAALGEEAVSKSLPRPKRFFHLQLKNTGDSDSCASKRMTHNQG
jgi:hypothetical protein